MRKIGIVGLALGLVALGLLPRIASAQAAGVVVNIPFAFTVENTKLPAGTYEIAKIKDWNYRITNQKSHQQAMFMTETTPIAQPVASFTLFFNAYGDQYFLSKFFHRGRTSGDMLRQTDAEKALAAKGPAKVKTVVEKTK